MDNCSQFKGVYLHNWNLDVCHFGRIFQNLKQTKQFLATQKQDGRAIITDNSERWLNGSSRNKSTTFSIIAKLWKLCDGLNMAMESNIHKLFVEVDAQSVISPRERL